MDADQPLPPECHDKLIISNGWRMSSSAEPRSRTESTARDEQPVGGSSNRYSVMVREKNEYLKTVRTGNNTNLFSLEAPTIFILNK